MKIGIDTRLLSRPLTGIGRYTLDMCLALAKIPNVSLKLYSPDTLCVETPCVDSVTVRAKQWKNPLLRQLWSETYLPAWAKEDEIDVFWGPAHRLPLRLSQSIARVVTIHDLAWKYVPDTMRLSTRLLDRYQMPLALQSADHIVADSRATADAVIKEFRVTSNQLTVVPLGKRTAGHKAMLDIKQPYFLFVGTREPRKNLTRLLEAYAGLPDTVKNTVSCVIAGGKGWGKLNITDTINTLNLQNNVILLGYVGEPTLSALYENCLFLAMPSLYEGFGLPLVEAMAYGKPVLTSNNSSMVEVAGDAGLLVDPLNVNAIRTGLRNMISNDALRETLALKAMPRALQFDWDISVKKLIRVFEQAIAVRKGQPS